MATTPLRELLDRRFGVREEEFAAALEEFADRTGPLSIVELRPTDYFGDAHQSVLTELGATLQPLEPGDLGPIAGLAAAHAEVIAHSVTVPALANRLGVDPSRVRQRIYARTLYAFKHRGVWLIPLFQVEGRALVPGLDDVIRRFDQGLHPVAVTRWFTSPNSDLMLDGSPAAPIAWLSAGGSPSVVAALAEAIDVL